MKRAPHSDIRPTIDSKWDSREKMIVVAKTIGISVISGAHATLIPSFMLYCSVSLITKINKGPGEIPALKPKIIPEIKKLGSPSNLSFPYR